MRQFGESPARRLFRYRTLSALAALAAMASMFAANAAAPLMVAKNPIKDSAGNTRIIVDFVDQAQSRYTLAEGYIFNPKTDRHHPQVLLLVEDYEKRLGFKRELMTSWVGASVTAFLAPQQIEQLRADPNVRLLTEDRVVQFSSPPWTPYWNGWPWGELNDWGRVAVNGKTLLPGSQRKVFIIDSGVAFHDDLASVSQRVNVQGTPYEVGCYAHATHVAGIVGATFANSQNRAGIYAGVNMVSVTGGRASGSNTCLAYGSMTAADVGDAIDSVRYSITAWFSLNPQVQIATMSMNAETGLGFSPTGVAQTNRTKLERLVTPAWDFSWYWNPGAFFVQSAGNQNSDACSLNVLNGSPAYKTSAYATSTSSDDGIMVVGAINSDGDAVSGNYGPFANARPTMGLYGEVGSNYGPCVDIWAPGNDIYSTWGSGLFNTTSQNAPGYSGGQPSNYVPSTSEDWQSYPGWAWLSGTSMAAPHVAAAAAYMADKYGLTSPAAIEAAVRQHWADYGKLDPLNQSIKVVYLPD